MEISTSLSACSGDEPRAGPIPPVRYLFPKPDRDGRTFIELTPLELLDRLAVLIPPPMPSTATAIMVSSRPCARRVQQRPSPRGERACRATHRCSRPRPSRAGPALSTRTPTRGACHRALGFPHLSHLGNCSCIALPPASDRHGWPLSHILCFAAPAHPCAMAGMQGLSGTIPALQSSAMRQAPQLGQKPRR